MHPPPSPSKRPDAARRLVVGIMTGTSLDGIDAALIRIDGTGLALRATLLAHASRAFGHVAADLRQLAQQQPMSAGTIARIALEFAHEQLHAIEQLLDQHAEPGITPDLIALHGQTVFHQPPLSWQLMNPWPIAQRFTCPIITDLRGSDLAAGGQGAPITPLADWILFRDAAERRAVINLGGFINITILPPDDGRHTPDDLFGFDLCACNQVLDAIARRTLGCAFDEDGRAASRGTIDLEAASALATLLSAQRSAHRSLGTGDEADVWIGRYHERLPGEDLAASAIAAIARSITSALAEHNVQRVILAGGGALNCTLRRAIESEQSAASHTSIPVMLSDGCGIPFAAREAAAMAILGALAADGVPITLPQITGRTIGNHRAGQWCVPVS